MQIFVHKQTIILAIKQGYHPKTRQSQKSSPQTKIHISNKQGQK